MHSYWDDFWALKGYDERRRRSPTALGRPRRRAPARARSATSSAPTSSPRCARAVAASRHRLSPGLGRARRLRSDVDDDRLRARRRASHRLPPRARDADVRALLARVRRRAATDDAAWEDYTPYELRNVGTFVRLGWRERAHELLDFFMAGRRPPAWNQWPEVVGRDPRQPRFVGDMPHGWVASDFIRAALDLFAYERDGDDALVLAAGVPAAWLDGAGIAMRGLRTPLRTAELFAANATASASPS